MTNWIWGHDYMGELQIEGKRYFLESIQFEEFTDSGHQTWNVVDQEGKEHQLEYMPNQKRKAEHDAKVRAMTGKIASMEIDEVIRQLTEQKEQLATLNKNPLKNGIEPDVGDFYE